MSTTFSHVKLKASKVIFQLTFNPKKKKKKDLSKVEFFLFKFTVVQFISSPYGVSQTLLKTLASIIFF